MLTTAGTAAQPDSPPPHAEAAHGPAVTATAVVQDRAGRVLVLLPAEPAADAEPVLPGVAVSGRQTPEEALTRALRDALGADLPAGRLLAVDSVPAAGGRAGLVHLYAAAPPPATATAAPGAAGDGDPDGLTTSWLDRDAALAALPALDARRLRAALDAWDTGAVAHLVGGEPQPGSCAAVSARRRAELEHAAALDPSSYLAVRPRVLVGAGALVRDSAGRLLLVRAGYRDDGRWQLPGGGVDSDLGETPRPAARRELREETGLDRPLGRLLAVDFASRRPAPALVVYVYDGGVLDAADLAGVRVDGTEIVDWRLAAPDEFDDLLPPRGAAIARAGLGALEDGGGPLDLVAGRPA
ncbi:NUDIX domain-containing protein [Streptomyces sp. WAC 06738]|uniref:NUDIX hydrolase n=1 Tax=Streptomyces sp. WAC 06738 TaxID=2203210 RepID=UPI000F6B76CF|nr:NUDIX hydrolase [Streptomyces sp. WAC 06738]AZM50190.1 NUDIX domain-containing protein [Streptomyces sp. WAC 06738]